MYHSDYLVLYMLLVLIDQIPAIQGSLVIKRRLGKGAFGEVFFGIFKEKS